jgi:hypothetical protein
MSNRITNIFKRTNILILLTIITLSLFSISFQSKFHTFDSYLNAYKQNEFADNSYIKIANTTWKESYVIENVTNLVKYIPAYIDNDKELDLLVLDSESKLYW